MGAMWGDDGRFARRCRRRPASPSSHAIARAATTLAPWARPASTIAPRAGPVDTVPTCRRRLGAQRYSMPIDPSRMGIEKRHLDPQDLARTSSVLES